MKSWRFRFVWILCVALAMAVLIAGAIACEGAMHAARPRLPVSFGPETLGEIRAHDGVVLRGVFEPPGRPEVGCVLVLHGIGDTHAGQAGMARMLAGHGFGVLTPDSRAQGWSDGTLVTYGVREAGDVRSWVDWMGKRDCGGRFYGLGESLGGAVLLQSLREETRLRAVVAESAYSSFPAVAQDRLAQMVPLPHGLAMVLAAPVVAAGVLYGNVRYHVNLADTSAVAAVRQTRTPILLIHGMDDFRTPVGNSVRIAEANPRIQLWEVPGAGHCGAWWAAPAEFEARVLGWFRQ